MRRGKYTTLVRELSEFGDTVGVLDAHNATAIRSQDAVILGRRTYQEWAPFWPTSTLEPFASFINGVTKYVASSAPSRRFSTPF